VIFWFQPLPTIFDPGKPSRIVVDAADGIVKEIAINILNFKLAAGI